MLSVIICSIKPAYLDALRVNIEETVGCDYEIVVHDNRQERLSIFEAYNLAAERARGEFLLFLHEDVAFLNEGWGVDLSRQLSEPTTGVVGLAGSLVKSRALSGWSIMKKYDFMNVRYDNLSIARSDRRTGYAQVAVLDGVFLAVRRDVWREFRFDSQTFSGFHCYDLDFSLSVGAKYSNYVSYEIEMSHFSHGSFDDNWLEQTHILHRKWEEQLPYSPVAKSKSERKKIECRAQYQLAYLLLKRHIGSKQLRRRAVWRAIAGAPFRVNNIELLLRFIK